MKPIPVRQIRSADTGASLNFRIRSIETMLAGSDMVQELHRHNFYFVLALTKGSGTHEIDFTPYEVVDNSVFILRPGQVHKVTLRAGSTGYLLEFNPDFYQSKDPNAASVLRQVTRTNFCRVEGSAFARVHSALTYIAQEFQDKKDGYRQIIRSNLEIFFIELLRHRKQHDQAPAGTAYEQEKFDQFLALLEENSKTQKQVSAYADTMNLSVYQLNSITKSALGKTASDVITDHVILEAKRYLLATSHQVNQIAHHLGYEDPSYFIRFFKKHTGTTPDAFRSNSR